MFYLACDWVVQEPPSGWIDDLQAAYDDWGCLTFQLSLDMEFTGLWILKVGLIAPSMEVVAQFQQAIGVPMGFERWYAVPAELFTGHPTFVYGRQGHANLLLAIGAYASLNQCRLSLIKNPTAERWVVIASGAQRHVWPSAAALPDGWVSTGIEGTKEACLAFLAGVMGSGAG